MTEQDNEFSPARAATRAPIGRTIRLQFDDSMEVVEALCVNISIGGMFVAIQKARPKGSLVRFELVLDDQRSVRGLGEVIWMRPPGGAEREAGIGIKFRFLEQRERQLIFKLVSQHIKDRLSKRPAEPLPADDLPPEPPEPQPPEPQPPEPQPPRSWGPRPEAPLDAAPATAADDFDLEPVSTAMSAPSERPPPAFLIEDPPSLDQLFSDFDGARLDPSAEPPSGLDAPAPSVAGLGVAPLEDGTAWDGGSLWDEGLGGGEDAAEIQRGGSSRRRRAVPVVAIVGLVVALAAIGFFLLRAGLFEPAEPMVPITPAPASSPPAVQTPALPEPEPAAENPPPLAQKPPKAEPVPPPPEPAVEPPPGASFSKLVDIAWASDPRGLKVVLTTDGPVPEGRYRHFRLDDGQPREVVRLLGMSERFGRTEIAVGRPELSRIRTGFHRDGGQSEIHVVLDLGGAGFGIVAIEASGSKLEIVIGKP